MRKNVRILLVGAVVALLIPWQVSAAMVDLPDGSKLDTEADCPVCTMKVGGGTPGPSAVVFKDGKVVGFDGAGDMFRYVQAPQKYGFDPANIKSIYVTDYTTKKFIDGKAAVFVLDSMVEGSMGAEVVPFANKGEAEKFKTEHKGNKIVAYSEVKADEFKPKKKMLKMQHDEGMKH